VASDQATLGPGDKRHLASDYGDGSSKKPSTTSLTWPARRAVVPCCPAQVLLALAGDLLQQVRVHLMWAPHLVI